MVHEVRDLAKAWRKGDGAKLARLATEGAVAWPGGGGYQTTPEEEERNIRESNLLAAFVTEDRHRIISLCTLRAKPGQSEHAFIPHLTCHPDFHGKKYGKAVLGAAVERACEAGFQKVDLYTWPANMKAVPLYKKMGFMWQPDTSVHMENFTPAARQHPLGRAFFARHGWYETLVRPLKLEEDLMKRGEVRVYEYTWRGEDGAFLRMVYDRQSWGTIEVENSDLLVSCGLAGERLVAGIPHPIRWRIENRGASPIRAVLSASGDPGIGLRRQEVLEVRDSAEVEGIFVIDPNTPEKTQEPRAAILRTEVLIAGVTIPLAAGVEVQQAIDVSVDPPRTILRPGLTGEAVLTLRSHLNRESTACLSVLPGGGGTVHRREHRIPVGPKAGAEVRVPVSPTGEGPVRIDVEIAARAGREKVPVKTKRIDLLAVGPEGVSACVGEDTATLCGGGLMATVDLKDGRISVTHRLRAERAHRFWMSAPGLGPPFSWEDFFQEKAEARVEEEPHGAAVRVRSTSLLRPGVMLDRRISLGQGCLLKVTDAILNGSPVPLDLSLNQVWGVRLQPRSDLVFPGKLGIHREPGGAGGRGLVDLKPPEEAEAWPEGWICRQREDGCAVGLLWGRAERVSPGSWRNEVRRKVGRLQPGQGAALEPIYAFVGEGNWQTVRGWWRALFGHGAPETELACEPTRRPIELRIDPEPLLIVEGNALATLSLRSAGAYELDGKVRLELPDGMRSDPDVIGISAFCGAKPVSRRLRIRAAKRIPPGPARIGLRFETDEAIYRSAGKALILTRRAASVQVGRDGPGGVITIGNGILTATVAPGFMGSIISLQRDGKEFLHSGYPKARPWGPLNPWHGGISPNYRRLWGSFHRERFHARIVTCKGRQGLPWRGVRIACTIEQERTRGQSLTLDYLLAPGADVLAVVATCRDEVGIRSDGQVGFLLFPSFGVSPGTGAFHNSSDASITPLAAPHYSEAGTWTWGGVAGEGKALFLSARGEGARAGGEFIPPGCLMGCDVEGSMPARGRLKGLFFVVPGCGPETVETHAAWSEFEELP